MPKRFEAGEVITAMVTPFNKNKEIDYDKAGELAKYLADNGTDTVLVAGTTGECPTLTGEEKLELLSTVKRAVGHRAKVMMGAGSNCTKTAVGASKIAEKEGADCILSVAPYYNKPSQAGIFEHYSQIAQSVKIPIILYNIPSRTGITISAQTAGDLANKYPNITGLKQSCPDMDMVSELKMLCPEDFVIYSGDDSLTLPMLSLGVEGVISVASHLWGKEIKTMIHNFKTGNYVFAKNMHLKLYPVFKKIFMATNPSPIKAALARQGIIEEWVRLPLTELTEAQKTELYLTIDALED